MFWKVLLKLPSRDPLPHTKVIAVFKLFIFVFTFQVEDISDKCLE